MEQKVFYFNGERGDIANNINSIISEGWKVENIVPMGQYSVLILCERKEEN